MPVFEAPTPSTGSTIPTVACLRSRRIFAAVHRRILLRMIFESRSRSDCTPCNSAMGTVCLRAKYHFRSYEFNECVCIRMYISSYNISREDLFDSKNPYVSVKIVCCVKFCLGGEKRKIDTERTCARVSCRDSRNFILFRNENCNVMLHPLRGQ